MRSRFFCSLIVAALCGSVSAEEVIKNKPNGAMNWSKGTVSAIGYGVPPDDVPAVKRRLLARRAAQLDAYRNLAEMVNGVRVTSETIVQEMVTQSDAVKTTLEAMIKGASMTEDHYQNDVATVTLTMSLDGGFIKMVAPHAAQAGQSANRSFSEKAGDWVLANMPSLDFSAISIFPQAMASENTEMLFITSTEQLELVKQLSSMLKDHPKEQVLSTLQKQIEFYESNSQFTGVLIDASAVTQFELATIPRIRDTKGNIIYPSEQVLMDGELDRRPVSYDFDVADAIRNQRIAVKPYVVKASGIYKSRMSDLVIDDESANLLKSQQTLLSALGNAGVMIVVAM